MRERRKRYASSQHPYTQIISLWGNKQQTKHHHRRRRVLFEEKTKRERERERDPSEKRRPKKRIIVIIIGKRNGRTMRDALKDTRSFVCTQHSRGGGFFLFVLFLGFRKKKRKKRRGEKGRGFWNQSPVFTKGRPFRSRLLPRGANSLLLFEDDSKRVAQTVLHGALFFCFVSLSLEHSCDF